MSNKSKAQTSKRRPTSVSDFKKKVGGTFELPSGAVMKLRNVGGLQAILTAGVMPNSLMSIVQKSLDKGKPMDTGEIIKPDGGVDPQMLSDMQQLMDQVTIMSAVEPKVHPVPTEETDRDDEILYVDELSMDDKMFIFQWVSGGTSDLEQFRQRHQENMDSLGAVAEDEGDA